MHFFIYVFELQEVNDSNGYDATQMLYPVYTSPDSSYQFVPVQMGNSEVDAVKGAPSDAVPSYVESPTGQVTVSYPYTGPSGIVPYANGNIGGGYNPGAFAVQSGYEGYLVPAPPQAAVEEKAVVPKSNNELPFIGSIQSTITSLTNSLPVSMRSFASQAFAVISALLGATLVGGGLTTAICTFTPLCTISFALPFTRSSFRSLAAPFVGEANVEILDSTLARLSKMQDKEKVEIAAKSSGKSEAIDVTSTKSLDGSDVTADVAGTIAKVAKVTKAAEVEASAAAAATAKTAETALASAEPAPKTVADAESNDK